MSMGKKTKRSGRVIATLFIVCMIFLAFPTGKSFASTSAQKEALRQEMRQMLYNVDTSRHDISKYNATVNDIKEIFADFKKDPEDKWMVAAYYSNLSLGYSYTGNSAKSVFYYNVDSDVKGRYQRLLENVRKIKSGVEPSMRDIDKIIYMHDCVDEVATYEFVAYQSYGAGGILGDGLGVCAGYTKALNLLLEDQGISAHYLASDAMNHGWTHVLLDGNWYHIDSTWDDTRTRSKGYVDHRFLLLNDDEISAGKDSHYGWEDVVEDTHASKSVKYSNWYVHDITGKMAFEEGYWYYVDTNTNCIMQNVAEGGKAKVIYDASGQSKIELIDATSTGITYKQNGVKKTTGYTPEADVPADPVTPTIPQEDIVGTTPVTYYLQLEEGTAFVSVGNGTIKEATTSRDMTFVNNNIVSIPDVSKYLQKNQTVEWNAITKSGAGKYFVKGIVKIIEVEEIIEEPVIPEGEEATFYLSKEGAGGLINVGTGLISEGGSSSKNDDILKRIVLLPDEMSKYVDDDECVVWVKLTTYTGGKRSTVRGEVRKK